MQNINLILKAGVPQRVPVAGNVLMVLTADQGNALTLDFSTGNAVGATLANMGPGARIAPQGGFTGVTVTAPEDGNVAMVVTNGDIDVQILQQNATIANGDASAIPVRVPAGQRLPVDIGGGAVNVTAGNVGLVPSGTAIADSAGQAVGTVGAQVLEAAAGRKRVVFRNTGNGQVALTSAAGTTFANAAIVLLPGDAWKETDAPQLAWFAVSDVGSSVAIQTVS